MQETTETASSKVTMPVSGRNEIINILQETGSPPPLIEHVLAVCARALKIAEQIEAAGLPVDKNVVEAGALMHDSGIPRQRGPGDRQSEPPTPRVRAGWRVWISAVCPPLHSLPHSGAYARGVPIARHDAS
jgi:hypothetical protein